MDKKVNPIDSLVARYRAAAANLEVTRIVSGFIQGIETVSQGDEGVHVLYVRSGSQVESFWTPIDAGNPNYVAPRIGDRVSGKINTLDDTFEFGGEVFKPIFDFKNHTLESEASIFDELRAYHARREIEQAYSQFRDNLIPK